MRSNLGQAIAHEPDSVHEQTIGRALNLKVSEKGVCTEQGKHFIEDIVALVIGVGRFVGRERRGGDGKSVCWSTGLGAEREEREISN